MATLRDTWALPACAAILTLAGCGGGSGSGGSMSYTVGGTVSGLSSGQSVTLANSGGTAVIISANGAFSFPTTPGSAYAVTVQSQTSGVACTVANGSGTVGSSSVTGIAVSCVAGYTVGGTASGLTSGESVTLLNNGGNSLTISANGAFSFATTQGAGSAYDVTQLGLGSTPCSIANGSGTIGSSNVTNIAVSCAKLGGTVSGLSAAESVTLLNNGGNALVVTQNGAFAFSAIPFFGSAYDVTVQTQTPGIKCAVTAGSGTIGSSDVTSVAVACAPTDTILYSFGATTTDGQVPYAGLVMDSAGNLYGTTANGGQYNYGTVFEISANTGTETILHSFAGYPNDGQNPNAGLIMDSAGNLYGTTVSGGAATSGAVFKINAIGTESLVYSFNGPGDGGNPYAGLAMDSSGNLYGTTSKGGANLIGAVFKVTPTGAETVLYSFTFGGDGQSPVAGLVLDSAGNLYGTTPNGGANNDGIVFKISPAGTETILYSFAAYPHDAQYPESSLIMDSAGNLYGTTHTGGANGFGTVFKLSAGGTESILYSFGATASDGQTPDSGLIMDSAGNLFGTTPNGGGNQVGVLFEVSAGGTETIVHTFGAGPDGQNPHGELVMDSAGNLYGAAPKGGANGDGAVFKVAN